MKHLIVNGDDFGMSDGVNRGIVEAHVNGILTSTSLMVDAAASQHAVALAAAHPRLGVGLHLVLPRDGAGAAAEVERQLDRFVALMERLPTHLDSHHDVHEDGRVLPAVLAAAGRRRLSLRGHGPVRQIREFYGRWGGEGHPEHVGPAALARLLRTDVDEGFTELCCHPGYVDGGLVSSYAAERETELATLCDPAVGALVVELGIRLVTFAEVRAP